MPSYTNTAIAPKKLGMSGVAQIAAERKPTMRLLPYGIPICFGAIAVFVYDGMLI